MAMSMGNGGGGRIPTALSEINVTPLVDVMLVLLIIFMITSSMETIQAQQEKELMRQEQLQRIEEMKVEPDDQEVPVNLPRVNSEPVNLTEQRKLVLTVNERLEFFIGSTRIASCFELAPELEAALKRRRAAGASEAAAAIPEGFRKCLSTIEDKLLENEKLQKDGELYLRADRRLDYGLVLMTMARIRKAGITKFGLVAEPDLEE